MNCIVVFISHPAFSSDAFFVNAIFHGYHVTMFILMMAMFSCIFVSHIIGHKVEEKYGTQIYPLLQENACIAV